MLAGESAGSEMAPQARSPLWAASAHLSSIRWTSTLHCQNIFYAPLTVGTRPATQCCQTLYVNKIDRSGLLESTGTVPRTCKTNACIVKVVSKGHCNQRRERTQAMK